MKKLLYLALLITVISATRSSAQFENVWVYGSGCGIDFNGGTPTQIPTSIDGKGEANASVCDAQGQLLFYTTGYKVWDKNGNLMPGGNGLINDPALPPLPGAGWDDYTSSTTQGVMIVPMPDQPGKYYIFSLTSIETGSQRLYYSVVDMQLNGGLGDVEPTQKGIFIAGGLTEHMTGVVGDKCNVWVLVVDKLQNELKAYSVSSSGIDPIPASSPLLAGNYYAVVGAMAASPDRTKLAIARLGMGLYDFDPATGIATGTAMLMGSISVTSFAYHACFSPGNSKLYVSYVPMFGQTFLSYQFDLSSGNNATIIASAYPLIPAVTVYKRGPDGRIYTTQGKVIQDPDQPGAACLFTDSNLPGACAGAGGGFPGLPAVVPVIQKDTVLTSRRDTAGCFASQIRLSASDTAGWDYTWNTGDAGPRLNATLPGTYFVSYYKPPCTFVVDTIIAEFPYGTLPTIDVRSSCKGSSNGKAWAFTFPGDTVNYQYLWYRTGGDTLSVTDTLHAALSGDYFLYVSTVYCDTFLSVFIPEEYYEVSFTVDTLACSGDLLLFQNTSDIHFTDHLWTFGDGTGSAAQQPSHVYSNQGRYEAVLIGTGAVCTDTASVFISVDTPLAGPIYLMDRDSLCAGLTVLFAPQSDDLRTTRLEWSFGDGSVLTTGNKALQHAFDSSGIMSVSLTVYFRACPEISFTDTVTVYPYPRVDLGPDTFLCLNGPAMPVANRVSGNAGDRFLWNTGDISAQIAIRHPGVYSLTVTNDNGCEQTDSIDVNKDCYIDIPNAFTPNGDGINDYFLPRQQLSGSLTKFSMQVLNRWGQLVFETTSIDGRGWDGRFNGQDQPAGVYVYLIAAEIAGVHKERYQGNVTLAR
jgi:gliding motility-associated-like protein